MSADRRDLLDVGEALARDCLPGGSRIRGIAMIVSWSRPSRYAARSAASSRLMGATQAEIDAAGEQRLQRAAGARPERARALEAGQEAPVCRVVAKEDADLVALHSRREKAQFRGRVKWLWLDAATIRGCDARRAQPGVAWARSWANSARPGSSSACDVDVFLVALVDQAVDRELRADDAWGADEPARRRLLAFIVAQRARAGGCAAPSRQQRRSQTLLAGRSIACASGSNFLDPSRIRLALPGTSLYFQGTRRRTIDGATRGISRTAEYSGPQRQ